MRQPIQKLLTGIATGALVLSFFAVQANAQDVPTDKIFFSEYIEGSSQNKGLEIYNAGDSTVTLTNYQIAQSSNGSDWIYFQKFYEGASIEPGAVYTLITDEFDENLFSHDDADEVWGYPSALHFNGDDARALIHVDPASGDTTWIDVFGEPNIRPVDGWDVAGVEKATLDHTLIRKPSVTKGNPTPLDSFGTNADDSEWIVKEMNDVSDFGKHTAEGSSGPVALEETADNPGQFSLSQNYPNPFNPSSNISFTLPEAHDVRLDVFNIYGQLVQTLVNGKMSAGEHTVQFNADNLASGFYLYRIKAGNFVQTKKMTLIK